MNTWPGFCRHCAFSCNVLDTHSSKTRHKHSIQHGLHSLTYCHYEASIMYLCMIHSHPMPHMTSKKATKDFTKIGFESLCLKYFVEAKREREKRPQAQMQKKEEEMEGSLSLAWFACLVCIYMWKPWAFFFPTALFYWPVYSEREYSKVDMY